MFLKNNIDSNIKFWTKINLIKNKCRSFIWPLVFNGNQNNNPIRSRAILWDFSASVFDLTRLKIWIPRQFQKTTSLGTIKILDKLQKIFHKNYTHINIFQKLCHKFTFIFQRPPSMHIFFFFFFLSSSKQHKKAKQNDCRHFDASQVKVVVLIWSCVALADQNMAWKTTPAFLMFLPIFVSEQLIVFGKRKPRFY